VLVDVTRAYSIVSVMGPAQRRCSLAVADDVSKAGLPFGTTRDIDVGYARVRAARMSYVGGPGYELCVPTDQCVTLYDALQSAGEPFGLRDAGYYTLDALRIEAGRRAWGAELSPDETPLEAGLGRAVASTSRRSSAAMRSRAAGGGRAQAPGAARVRRPGGVPLGRRAVPHGRAAVGELTSAGFSRMLGRALAFGYARGEAALSDAALLAARYEVDIAGERFAVTPRIV
jgi:4-methylaminobutanoate oxidase (formaldehyde-forming)